MGNTSATINPEIVNDIKISQSEYDNLLNIVNENKIGQIQLEINIFDKLMENLKTTAFKSFRFNQDQSIEKIKIGGDMDV